MIAEGQNTIIHMISVLCRPTTSTSELCSTSEYSSVWKLNFFFVTSPVLTCYFHVFPFHDVHLRVSFIKRVEFLCNMLKGLFVCFSFYVPFSLFKSNVSKNKFWEIRLLRYVLVKYKTSRNVSDIAVQSWHWRSTAWAT